MVCFLVYVITCQRKAITLFYCTQQLFFVPGLTHNSIFKVAPSHQLQWVVQDFLIVINFQPELLLEGSAFWLSLGLACKIR